MNEIIQHDRASEGRSISRLRVSVVIVMETTGCSITLHSWICYGHSWSYYGDKQLVYETLRSPETWQVTRKKKQDNEMKRCEEERCDRMRREEVHRGAQLPRRGTHEPLFSPPPSCCSRRIHVSEEEEEEEEEDQESGHTAARPSCSILHRKNPPSPDVSVR